MTEQQINQIIENINKLSKDLNLSKKYIYQITRFALTGKFEGIDLKGLFSILSRDEIIKRWDNFEKVLEKLKILE
jgi:glutamyl/glutaminyl-tRNA synthetase